MSEQKTEAAPDHAPRDSPPYISLMCAWDYHFMCQLKDCACSHHNWHNIKFIVADEQQGDIT